MRFERTRVFNIEGAMRGMRFPLKSRGDTVGDMIGRNDLDLAQRLWKASEEDNLAHSKFLRQIFVSVDITAPLYFWSEMDQYRIGVTTNSESTMHRLMKDAADLTLDDFQYDSGSENFIRNIVIPELKGIVNDDSLSEIEKLRQLKQKLPTSYLQKRHWTANYEIVRNIYNQRRNHKLTEWNTDFANWARRLPYSKQFISVRGV